MTEKIFPSVMLEKMKPKFVAPLGTFKNHTLNIGFQNTEPKFLSCIKSCTCVTRAVPKRDPFSKFLPVGLLKLKMQAQLDLFRVKNNLFIFLFFKTSRIIFIKNKPHGVFKTELENPNLLSGKHLDEATVENVAENFEKICEFDEKTLKLNDIQDATARVMEAVIKEDSLVNKGKVFPVQMYLKHFGKK